LFILNNDIEARGDIVTPLLSRLEADKRIGAISPRLEFPDGRFQLSWGDAPSLWSEYRERGRQRRSRRGESVRDREEAAMRAHAVDWITGAAMVLPRGAWEAIDGFDERYFFYFEDVDLCTRLWHAGYTVDYEPAACLTHVGGGSDPGSNPRIVRGYRMEQLRYYARWRSLPQFLLLKLYLFAKFAGTALRGGDAARALLGDILRATRRGLLHRS
jgi:GT2 family glycosyltransferase